MKIFRRMLTLFMVSVCSWPMAWAVNAPVFPEGQTLESGKSYYLYNVGSDQFVYCSSSGSSDMAYSELRTPVMATLGDDGICTFQFEGKSYYIISDGSNVTPSSSTSSTYVQYRKFLVTETEDGYTIQRNYNFNASQYVGNNNATKRVYANFTSGNIVWRFYDAAGAEAIIRYRAKKALYDALVSAADYTFATAEYEALYDDESATNEELLAAADMIVNGLEYTDKLKNNETEFPLFITRTTDAEDVSESATYVRFRNGVSKVAATLDVDQDAVLTYLYQCYNATKYSFNVYLDGELYEQINSYEGEKSEQRFFVELTKGHHIIEWVATSTSTSSITYTYLHDIGVWKTPTITVNLTQAGSLGTEILYNVDHVKDVRKLVVKGEMNSNDWSLLNMMTNLFDLDLSQANAESMPSLHPGDFFYKLKLPKTLKEIQDNALSGTSVEDIEFPEGLTSIGYRAFYQSRIREAALPAMVNTVGKQAFYEAKTLERVVWPSATTTIPEECFYRANAISDFVIPEGVTTIERYAFFQNYSAHYNLPSTITSIGFRAFQESGMADEIHIAANATVASEAFLQTTKLKKVVVGEGVNFQGTYPFYQSSVKELELPTSFSYVPVENMFTGCTLEKVTLKSPTKVGRLTSGSNTYGLGGLNSETMVYVPSYLVSAYKLDSYWYNYNIMGFSTADISDWNIRGTLTFYSQDRFEGTPNVTLTGRWTINGELEQQINNFTTRYYSQDNNYKMSRAGMMISNCENVSIKGDYTHSYYAYNATSGQNGRWHFICLPFDLKVGDITASDDARFAVRYYDGANRAENGTGGNWKNYSKEDVIPAGTGFIIQASKECELYFKAQDNASKQNVVSNRMFVKALQENASEQKSNKGWNLVGNPWLCYYNIHKMNFTAPITVYDGYNKKYMAYSVIDDDYAIQPNQAFFVQCPDEVSTISFPIDGRQLTSEIESQNGAKPNGAVAKRRQLIDLQISDGELTDQTRVVINDEASTDYEMVCDASKFFDLDGGCPLIYSLENDEPLAINERPRNEGIVSLGLMLPVDGTFTICAERNDLSNAILVDNALGKEADLSLESYTFSSEAGYDQTRFELRLGGSLVTEIGSVLSGSASDGKYYNLNGQAVEVPMKGVYVVNGRKVIVK